ncbi:cytochrome bd-I oxidase subunit CydX [Mesorhizobium sp. NZP2077]|nr:cytochrome bd-I oxidase subunit CydX [Mesorhizobium sp. NZP2077]QKC86596.1 cytochrome bd-I oxidase subunit CydX [Mesorhizobium sp. NZP2077]QKD18858.1 cytochrome bd-I oxidase subunit CydX [Mesorhizobium sp. NZP2077]
MWYFSWILGVGLACSFAILNAMWFEMREDRRTVAVQAARPGIGRHDR